MRLHTRLITPSPHYPITLFSAAMSALKLEPSPCFAVAVSGGPDSMALLLLANAWVKQYRGEVIALTVDHGLRKESAEEARQVAAWCKSLGIEHQVLTWEHATPTASIQEAAREARYHLLTHYCKKNGIRYLLTAHHRGDQAETLFFRLARGSNLRGLACIQPASVMSDVQLMRPLLGIGKSALIHYLREQNQSWIEDPSNAQPYYTRNVIRAALQSLPNAEEIEVRASAVAEAFGRIRAILDSQADEAFRQTVRFDADGATIDAVSFAQLPAEIAFLVAGKLICGLTGNEHPPRTEKLSRLTRWLAAPDSRESSLAHVRFMHLARQGSIIARASLAKAA